MMATWVQGSFARRVSAARHLGSGRASAGDGASGEMVPSKSLATSRSGHLATESMRVYGRPNAVVGLTLERLSVGNPHTDYRVVDSTSPALDLSALVAGAGPVAVQGALQGRPMAGLAVSLLFGPGVPYAAPLRVAGVDCSDVLARSLDADVAYLREVARRSPALEVVCVGVYDGQRLVALPGVPMVWSTRAVERLRVDERALRAERAVALGMSALMVAVHVVDVHIVGRWT